MKKLLSLILLITLIVCPIILYSEEINIFVLNTGDLHESYKDHHKGVESFVNEQRDKHKNRVILVDAGDMITHFPFFGYEIKKDYPKKSDWAGQNDKMYQWAQTMNYDAMVLGNHDFIGGIDLLERYKNKLPFVCSNLEYPNTSPYFLGKNGEIPPYRIIYLKNGLKVGIIGISDQDGDDYHFPKGTSDKKTLTAHSVNNDTIKKYITDLEGRSDFIIVLSHNKDDVDKKYITQLPSKKICVVIGGHSHNRFPKTTSDLNYYPPLIKSQMFGNYVGKTTITWDTKERKVKNVKVENWDVNHDVYAPIK